MPTTDVKCPNSKCGFAGKVDESRVGTRVVCSKCGTSFLVTRGGKKDAHVSPSGDGWTPVAVATPAVDPSSHSIDNSILTLPGGITMEFVPIPAGAFLMGSPGPGWLPGWLMNEGPQHQVRIAYSFWLAKYPVTQAQWTAVMGNNPSRHSGDPRRPVENVSWNQCQLFIQKVNDLGQGGFRLPSEAEWEYACLAGAAPRHAGDKRDFGSSGWHFRNSDYATHPVGQKLWNRWRLCDMIGNVWEWCQDSYHSKYNGAPTDGSAWENPACRLRVMRGGSFSDSPNVCDVVSRRPAGPDASYGNVGFRMLRT